MHGAGCLSADARSGPDCCFFAPKRTKKPSQPVEAAADYQAIYTRFAVSEQAREAAVKLGFLLGSSAGPGS